MEPLLSQGDLKGKQGEYCLVITFIPLAAVAIYLMLLIFKDFNALA